MREIKFRHPITERDGKFKEWFYWGFIDGDFITPANQLNGQDNRNKSQQFTGLKDKNGKEIFEGDIVKLVEANRLYTVEFVESMFKLIHADPQLNKMHWGAISRVNEMIFTIEIVGNIYENPELL